LAINLVHRPHDAAIVPPWDSARDRQRTDAVASLPPGGATRRMLRAVVCSALALVALAAILVCARRATGAIAVPLPAAGLWAAAGCLAIVALAFRAVVPTRPLPGSPANEYVLWALPSLALALAAAGLSLVGSANAGLAGLWGLLLVEEGWSWGRLQREALATVPPAAAMTTETLPDLSILEFDHERLEIVPDVDSAPSLPVHDAWTDESVSQQIVRRRDDDVNSEVVEGWLRVAFVAGQRHATAHVAVCPPLEGAPECQAEQAAGPPAGVKVAQVLSYGARLEVKLDEPADASTSVIVEFSLQGRPCKKA
jgi:hypothetical protein